MQLHAKPGLIDGEAGSKPSNEESHQDRVGIRKGHGSLGLAALAGVQRQTEHRQITARQPSDERIGFDPTSFDLGEFADVEWVGLVACVPSIPGFRYELDVTDPHRHRTLRHAEFIGDLLQCPRLGAQLACSMSFKVFAAIAHASIMTGGCHSLSVGVGSAKTGCDSQVDARIGRVGDSLPVAGSSVTPSTKPVGSTPSKRSLSEPSPAGRKRPADVAPSSATSHS